MTSVSLDDFGTPFVTKAKPGAAKANTFWYIFGRWSMASLFCHSKTGKHTVFVLILRRIWTRFGIFLLDFSNPADRFHQVYEWFSEHVKMHNFHHFLKRFLTFQKSSLGQRLVDFLEQRNKTFSRKIIKFWGICRLGDCFLIFFTRRRKKRDTGDDLGVPFI